MPRYPDFKEFVSEYHSGLIKFVEDFNRIGYDSVTEYFEEKPEARLFLLEMLANYDRVTLEGYFNDSARPYYNEDHNGFRYDADGYIVRYPRSFYDEARNEYLKINEELRFYLGN